jgi:hypothetical protein
MRVRSGVGGILNAQSLFGLVNASDPQQQPQEPIEIA